MNKQFQQFKQQLEGGKLAQSFLVSGPEFTGKFSAVVKMVGILNNLENEALESVRRGEMMDTILIETEVSAQNRLAKDKSLKKDSKKTIK